MIFQASFSFKNIASIALATVLMISPTLIMADSTPDGMGTEAQTPISNSRTELNQRAHDHQAMMLREMRKLHLSLDQQKNMQDLQKKFVTRYAPGTPLTRAQMKAHQRAMMAILTPEQREIMRHDMRMYAIHHSKTMNGSGLNAPESPSDSSTLNDSDTQTRHLTHRRHQADSSSSVDSSESELSTTPPTP